MLAGYNCDDPLFTSKIKVVQLHNSQQKILHKDQIAQPGIYFFVRLDDFLVKLKQHGQRLHRTYADTSNVGIMSRMGMFV